MKLEYIIETIEWRSGIKFDGPSRERNRSYLRSLYYTLAREYTNQSISEIARQVNRDHSTAIHGLKLFEQAYAYEPQIRELYEDFLSEHPDRPSKIKMNTVDELKALRSANDSLLKTIEMLDEELKLAYEQINTMLTRMQTDNILN